jgi:ribose 5-phosphate isomerase B
MTDSIVDKPTIALGSDHAGYGLKSFLKQNLLDSGYEVIDCGTDSTDSVDYPDFAGAVCATVTSGAAVSGVLVCSTGVGISIAANKVHGIRAALCHTEFTAAMSRQHNNANVIALGANVLGDKQALAIMLAFLGESYSHGERHQRRIDKIDNMDSER